jgi:hypothetical protein
MSRYSAFLFPFTLGPLMFISTVAWLPVQAAIATQEVEPTGSTTALHWQSLARFHHGVKSKHGTLKA